MFVQLVSFEAHPVNYPSNAISTGWRKITSLAIIVEFPNSVSAILYAVWDIACELVRQPVRATKNFLKNPLVPPWKFAQKSCGHPFANFQGGTKGFLRKF